MNQIVRSLRISHPSSGSVHWTRETLTANRMLGLECAETEVSSSKLNMAMENHHFKLDLPPVTTRIITLVGNPYIPSFVTIASWVGVDPRNYLFKWFEFSIVM